MSRAKIFIEKCKVDGIYIRPGRDDLVLTGPDAAVAGARAAIKNNPTLAGQIEALLKPSDEDMQEWLGRQGDAVREEYRARTERLEAAGIDEPEKVSLRNNLG